MSDEENKSNLTNEALINKNKILQEQIIKLEAKLEIIKDLYNELIDRRL